MLGLLQLIQNHGISLGLMKLTMNLHNILVIWVLVKICIDGLFKTPDQRLFTGSLKKNEQITDSKLLI